MTIIDSDQHLFESRTMWQDHIDPAHRDDALAIAEDELGYSWLTWRDQRLELADVQLARRHDGTRSPPPTLASEPAS